jgi:hypothetical protein
MPQITTTIDIDAPAARVWGILTDFPAYPSWNPFVRSIAGVQDVGATLSVTVQPSGASPMSFKPRLIVYEPCSELRWRGQVLMPGIFDGEHSFQFSPIGPGRVRFDHCEIFTGILAALIFRGGLRRATEQGFIQMNEALKRRAERPHDA